MARVTNETNISVPAPARKRNLNRFIIGIVLAFLISGLVGSYFAFWQNIVPPVTNPPPTQSGSAPVITPTGSEIDSDGDGFNDWFETNIAGYDPNIPNDRYFILFYRMMKPSDYEADARSTIKHEDYSVNLPAQFLIEKGKVPSENIFKLAQEEATASALKNAVEQVAKKSDKNDLVYVMIEAHGDGSTPLDVRFFTHEWDEWVYYATLNEWLNQIEAKVLILSIGSCGDEIAIPVLKEGPCPRIIYLHGGGCFLHMFGLDADYSKEITTYYSNDPYISIGEAADCLDDQGVYLSDWNITRERRNAKRIVTYKRDGNYHQVDESKAKILAIGDYLRVEIDSSLYPWSHMVDPSNIAYEISLTDYKIPS